MLNALESYQFDENPVRVVMVEDEPWFVAGDVAAVLGYRNSPDMVRNLQEDERGTHIVRTLGGDQTMNVISESGLYAAIFKSRREEAQRFRRWVTGEVLPAIRRTGHYKLFDPDPPIVPQLPSPAIEDAELGKLNTAIGIAREARQIWGREDCRVIWTKLGLPSPIADAIASPNDPFHEQVSAAVADKESVTMAELAGMLGLPTDMKASLRMGAALRLMGWTSRNERFSGGQAKVWRRIPRVVHAPAREAGDGE